MSSQVTLEMIYNEIKQINKRLSLVEDTVEGINVKDLPRATVSKQEQAEIKRAVEEMKESQLFLI